MRVSTCCCGCSLELGCKIIAVLGLIGGGLGFLGALGVKNGGAAQVVGAAYIAQGILVIVAAGLLLWGTL